MTMETAGSLKDGGEIWGLAKISEDFELAGDDLIKGYLLINQPHIVGIDDHKANAYKSCV